MRLIGVLQIVLVCLPAMTFAEPPSPPSILGPGMICGGLLPHEIDDALNLSYPTWLLQTEGLLDAEDRELWMKSKSGDCPGVVLCNFFGSKNIDYVVLLVPKNPKARGMKVLLFSKDEKTGRYQVQEVANGTDYVRNREVIWRPKADFYEDFYDRKGVQFKQGGFVIETLEASASLLYWSKGRIQTLLISD